MRRVTLFLAGATVLLAALIGSTQSGQAQRAAAPEITPRAQLYSLEDALLRWPLPAGQEQYGKIDGKHIHQMVVEQAAIARRYRDAGHPKFWGRIIGTSSDAESAEWLAAKYKAIGLTDVKIQPFDLLPQWIPQTWDVTVTGMGKTIKVDSAQPDHGSDGTTPAGLDVEAVYVGLGSEADFMGKDVRGKAVFIFNMLGLPSSGGVRRAEAKGAAAIFEVDMLPGNMRYQAYPSGTKVPAFTVGNEDGFAVRDLIVASAGGAAPRVKLTADFRRIPNLKTSLVWGTLPGASDETIYIVAHRDGWFDASGDNAGGVAAMVGLAEYYSKIPQTQRRRTMVFVGLDGHHNSGEGAGVGRRWMWDERAKLFPKTALMINAEHPSTILTFVRNRYSSGGDEKLLWTNTYMPQQWYAGGPSRLTLEKIAIKAFHEFGASMELDPNPRPPAGDLGAFFRGVPGVATSEFHHYFHTDQETPEAVPWTGLEASTRSYAKIIDEVNKLPLSDLQRPEEPAPAQAPPPTPTRPTGAR